MTRLLLIPVALLLDRLLGEPRRLHPLVGFGRYAAWLEGRLNRDGGVVAGGVALLLAVGPWVAGVAGLAALPPLAGVVGALLDLLLLYLAIGARSLTEHGEAVAVALEAGELERARERAGWMVSRDLSAADEAAVSRAALESLLENGNDALFGALFWFALLGAPGVVLYRLVNTLDAMWGYRTPRYLHFGRVAARLDDLLNFPPARLTALTYALLGRTGAALRCWRRQAAGWEGVNPGVVMAAGAGALGVRLGGPARYHGEVRARPELGEGGAPTAAEIRRAARMVNLGGWLWALMAVVVLAVTTGGRGLA